MLRNRGTTTNELPSPNEQITSQDDAEDQDYNTSSCRWWAGGLACAVSALCFLLAVVFREHGVPLSALRVEEAPLLTHVSKDLSSRAGVRWSCTNSNKSVAVPARIPGVVHEALLDAGVLASGDPLYRFNEREYNWVGLENWTFIASFELRNDVPADRALLTTARPVLDLEGVDTVATITLNGVRIGEANSAFLRWRYALPAGLLREGANRLEVAFVAAGHYANAQRELYPYEVPFTNYYHLPPEPFHRNFVRKTPSDFGWDWGPAFIPCGITGSARLHNGGVSLDGVRLEQHLNDAGAATMVVRPVLAPREFIADSHDGAVLSFHAELCFPDCAAPMEYVRGCVDVALDNGEGLGSDGGGGGGSNGSRGDNGGAVAGGGAGTGDDESVGAAVSLVLSRPHLWWPRGYGDQPFYQLRTTLHASSACDAATPPPPLSPPLLRRVGVRTVQLVTEPAPAPTPGTPPGETFYFRVNGVAVFAKGANLIPAHVFATGESDERWAWLLQMAAEAEMNMVRVWGGGRYQRDAFYDECDALGLLVWQELMFACALYPRDEAFLQLVAREAEEQVTRLATHPSIAVWGANNENEAALRWYAESRASRDVYLTDFVKLYVETLRPAVLASDGLSRPFVDTSPSNGLLSEMPYVKRWGNVNAKDRKSEAGSFGDIHHYDYDADCEDPSVYPAARFISEHGFQSFPSFRLYRAVTEPQDWSRDSELLEYRMRHPKGTAQMLAMIQRHYRVPPAGNAVAAAATSSATATAATNSATATLSPSLISQQSLFDAYLYLTQLQQARCYETAFSAWRRMRSADARTMGILYWQLNDVWQGPSWSTIEYDGSLRLAHHAVRRVFAPVLLSAVLTPSAASSTATVVTTAAATSPQIQVSLTSDLLEPVSGILTIQVIRWFDAPAAPRTTMRERVRVSAASSAVVASAPLTTLLANASATREDSFLRLLFEPDAPTSQLHNNVEADVFPLKLSDVDLPRGALSLTLVKQLSPTRAVVEISANATVVFAAVESLNVVGAFGDGMFTLLAGSTKPIGFKATAPFELDTFSRGLRLRSLRDSYI